MQRAHSSEESDEDEATPQYSRRPDPWAYRPRITADDDDFHHRRDDDAARPMRPLAYRDPPMSIPRCDVYEMPRSGIQHVEDRSYAASHVSSPTQRSGEIAGSYKDSIGLTVLHEPDGPPLADLVFVHSLGGGSVSSWSDHGIPGTFWPGEWLARERWTGSARISSYGYNSQVTHADRLLDLNETAKDLLAKLRFAHNREGRALEVGCVPLIFVAHALGGLVAKKAYLLARSDPSSSYSEIASATSAFAFFSTPHRGLHKSTINDMLSVSIVGWRAAINADAVKRSATVIQDINEKFRDFAAPLDIYSFYVHPAAESSYRGLALSPQLTTLDHPCEAPIPLEIDQSTSIRYSSIHDPDYNSVKGALCSLVEKFQSRRKAPAEEDTASQAAEVDNFLKGCGSPQEDFSFFSERKAYGSCQWILEHPTMESFLHNEDPSPSALWCYGGPGSGKSVTATFLIEHLQDESRPCVYYYFRSGNQDKNNLSQFLTSLASQISQHSAEYRRKLSKLASDRLDVNKAGHRLLWKELFVVALLQCRAKKPLYIVIDGLDELAHSRELLQKMLVELGNSRSYLRIVLVSRGTTEIETSIERLSKRLRLSRMALDCHSDDLALYVREEMDVMMGGDDFKERIVKQILAKAGQNFLWAHLVVKEILDCHTEIQVESALQQVPKELEPLYERMDSRIAELLQSRPQDRAMGHIIITWAACSRRPLHLHEIKSALEYDFPGIIDPRQAVQRLCGEFVHVDKKGHVSMMHASAREYLMSNARLNYFIRAQEANHKIFSRCIKALTSNRRSRAHHEEEHGGFLHYAASSWPYHLTQSSDFGDLESLSLTIRFLTTQAVLDWIFKLASAGSLKVVVEASKALNKFCRTLDRADRERSPLTHRLHDRELVNTWSQDLIRVVGRFGPQLVRHPRSVYELMPPFCPKGSMIYKQFGQKRGAKEQSPLSIRGNLNAAWDDTFARFNVPGNSLPHSIKNLDRYFAILTKANGIIHLYYSSTCEIARQFDHQAMVLAWCVDTNISRIATYGARKTIVWSIESGTALLSIDNSRMPRALDISFQQNPRGEGLMLLALANDRSVRSCALDAMQVKWETFGTDLDDDMAKTHRINSPHNAQFSPDGLYVAISYRGAYPSVWYMGGSEPHFIAHCDHRGRMGSNVHQHARTTYVVDFAWSPMTGHLLGVFNDGIIFKWHPIEDDFLLSSSDFRSGMIKCSADGRLFVSGSGGGALRVWDMEQFTPVYEMHYPVELKDLDLGPNDARIYDIREQYCNIWEPSSLLRAIEADDDQSDVQSTKASERPSLGPDARDEQGSFTPVTALATCLSARYAKGDDNGHVTVCDFDGKVLLGLAEQGMSIEKLVWSVDGSVLADVDLGREIRLRKIEVDTGAQQLSTPKLLRSFAETDEVLQLVFDTSGQYLLLATPEHVKVHDVWNDESPRVVPEVHTSRWITSPLDEEFVLGFGAHEVIVTPWRDLTSRKTLVYEETDDGGSGRLRLPMPRRPSEAYPTSPSEIDLTVNKVLASPSSSLILVEVFGSTKQRRRRAHCLLLDAKRLVAHGAASSVPVCSISPKLAECLYVSLGFVDPGYFSPIKQGPSTFEGRPSVTRLSTFAFVSNDFWVCSANIGIAQREEEVEIRRHFFLPRDWQNTDWLEMAKVTHWGDFLCPRNGEIAVVTNGFVEGFRE